MANKVQIINNPFKRKLSILIDGTPISTYSNLEKNMAKPFYTICDSLLSDLSRELNGAEFDLEFQSRKIELEIMEQKAKQFPSCRLYSSVPLEYDLALNKRLALLNQLFKDEPIENRKYFIKKLKIYYSGIDDEVVELLQGIKIKNDFCSLDINVAPFSSFAESNSKDELSLFVTKLSMYEKIITKAQGLSGFIIVLGENYTFLDQIGNLFCFQTNLNNIIQCIFDCIMFVPLEQVLYDSISSLPSDYLERHTHEIDRIQSSNYRIWISLESNEIELGHSVQFDLQTDQPGSVLRLQNFTFEYKDSGIVACNGMRIEGISEGQTTVYVFKRGEILPCTQVSVSVFKRNRITKINLISNCLTLGEGDTEKLEFDYYPTNADNSERIDFHSENSEIASVNGNGIIRGKKSGTCRIWITAEQISAECVITVLPYLEEINCSCEEYHLTEEETVVLEYSVVPENSIDNSIKTGIIDTGVAYLEDDIIHAYRAGKTELVLESLTGRIRKTIPIIVEKKELLLPKKKKSGLFSRLFE